MLDDVSERGGGTRPRCYGRMRWGQEDGTLSSLNRETSVKLFRYIFVNRRHSGGDKCMQDSFVGTAYHFLSNVSPLFCWE